MYWDIFVAVCQALVYVAVAGVIGGGFCWWLCQRYLTTAGAENGTIQFIQRYLLVCAAIGLVFAIGGYLGFIGSINQSGVAGVFDTELILFLIYDPPGLVAITQVPLFIAVLISSFWMPRRWAIATYIVALVPLAFSFTLRGHIAPAPLWAQLALIAHVLMMSVWAGSLLPLWRIARDQQRNTHPEKAQQLLIKFGDFAAITVGLLALAGVIMLFYLLASPSQLLHTYYGIAILLKLATVALLLGCAAANKWLLVPNLNQPEYASWLPRVIYVEMLCVIFIFALTATLTLVIGRP